MEENIAKRFENFGTLQAKQSDNPSKKSDIRSSVFSIPGDGNYGIMINPNEPKNITPLYPDNCSDDVELKGLDERYISFSTGEARNLHLMSQNSNDTNKMLLFHQRKEKLFLQHCDRQKRQVTRQSKFNNL